ncbi:MAG: excinuclease ABC subunit UvrA [Patescibacteria group bacterium]
MKLFMSKIIDKNQSKNVQHKTGFFSSTIQPELESQLENYNNGTFLEGHVVPNPHEYITIRHARQHNLKDVSLVIPKNKLVVFSGISGSGKSSLVFDTIYAEGQRRYVESLSSYARQFLGLKDKPDVDSIDGLSPAISIDQKSTSNNPRSTVGTITEIYDYLRLLYAKIGQQHCPVCNAAITSESITAMLDRLMNLPENTKVVILSPMVDNQKGLHKGIFKEIRQAGFVRVRVNDEILLIEEAEKLELNRQQKHSIEIVVDRLSISPENRTRLMDSLETALNRAKGRAIVLKNSPDMDGWDKIHLNQARSCPNGHGSQPELEPRMFSFNSPHGACPHCTGLGVIQEIDKDLVIPNETLSIKEGCIRPLSRLSMSGGWLRQIFDRLSEAYAFSLKTPWKDLNETVQDVILFGTAGREGARLKDVKADFEGVIPNLMRRYKDASTDNARRDIEQYMSKHTCPMCQGSRLRQEALSVTVAERNVASISGESIHNNLSFFKDIMREDSKALNNRDSQVARLILKEISSRLEFLVNVGLGYLTLGRGADTLSGGEAQRIRLATQIGSGLTGVLYILDEPSIGLHQRDNTRLLETLKRLRDLGNSVLVVEHDEETIREADYLVDVGPGAGKFGGEVVAAGTPEKVSLDENSVTGRFLAGKEYIEVTENRRPIDPEKQKYISIVNASENNLKDVTCEIPLSRFVAVTGVSGSGKSTLINDILANGLMQYFYDSKTAVGEHEEITGLNNIDKPIIIDQSPIGRTPRSNPATYTGLFTYIRDLYASLPESKARGYQAGRFSFNVPGGRCETCQGDGVIKVEMNFLPDVYVTCEDCNGRRYNRETLEILYNDKSISDVLDMPVSEGVEFFTNIPLIRRKLETLNEVGLGYIHLGQPATTLSGGEAQRIKLATELSKVGTGNTLYILDEPTTGLHLADVKKLLLVLHKLVDKGNTVLVIEHNLDVIKTADWVIDLGPEGGDEGGEIVAVGTPEDIIKVSHSWTGRYLKDLL